MQLMLVWFDAGTQAAVEDIDWSAVDDLGCGIELEVSGDARHQPIHTSGSHGKLLLLLFYFDTSLFVSLTVELSPLSRNRKYLHLSSDDCVEDIREDCQTYSALLPSVL